MSRRKSRVAVWRDAVRDSELDRTAKLVAFTLSTYMNGRGGCYPGRSSIAAGCALSVDSVDRALARLEAVGWLTVERSNGGRGRTNSYYALLPETAAEVRRFEWETAAAERVNGRSDGSKRPHPRGTKALESTESVGTAAASLSGSAAVPEEECPGCGQVSRLGGPDFIYCDDCLAERVDAHSQAKEENR